ncbi:aldo/keto reductase [Martelella alba]|uniref:Aldo/keto reductase n=1 Tax=Martelella alba TaxID=2590451 RepID=A0A506U3D4_9HYPH|nr:aldo/keto reductase [Martelella alba]TPW27836.1 aldo/keto reductase [Martelella alba]
MHFRNLGATGLSIAPVVFGGNVFGWTADEPTSFDLLDRFTAAGFNAIDTADVYSAWVPGHQGGESETIIGRWLKQSATRREDVIIITKVGSPMGENRKGLGETWIMQAVEASLKRLQTDHIDLYLAHWPDADVAHAETLSAFARLRDQGKIRAFGCSNYDAAQLRAAIEAARQAGLPSYGVLQPEYNLLTRDKYEGALAEICVEEDIGVIPYYSLAAGLLTGKYRSKADFAEVARSATLERFWDERAERVVAALIRIADELGEKPATIALAWLMTRRGITAPIASATRSEQLERLLRAPDVTLSDEALTALQEAGA